jgi:hypothetical protein
MRLYIPFQEKNESGYQMKSHYNLALHLKICSFNMFDYVQPSFTLFRHFVKRSSTWFLFLLYVALICCTIPFLYFVKHDLKVAYVFITFKSNYTIKMIQIKKNLIYKEILCIMQPTVHIS